MSVKIIEHRRRREQLIREEEERMRLYDIELNRREARIQHMEQTQKMLLLYPLEDKGNKLQEDRKRLEDGKIEICKRDEALKERQILKSDQMTQKENMSETIRMPSNATDLEGDTYTKIPNQGANKESK